MTGGKVLPAIQVDMIGRNFRNLLPTQYLPLQERRHRLIVPSNRTTARKCLFGQSDPVETQKMYEQCVENGRQRVLKKYQFDIITEKFCASPPTNNSSNKNCGTSSTNSDVVDVIVDDINVQSNLNELNESISCSNTNNDNDNDLKNNVEDRLMDNNRHQNYILNGANDYVENMCNEISDDKLSNKNVIKRMRSHPYAKITGKYNFYRQHST